MGGVSLSKDVRLQMEDIDKAISALEAEYNAKSEMMHMVFQALDDPASNFKLRMPGRFAQVKQMVSSLSSTRDRLKDKCSEVLAWFKVTGMKTGDFMRLWDDFLIPGDMIVNTPQQTRRDTLVPRFCSNNARPVSLNDLAILWGFAEGTAIE